MKIKYSVLAIGILICFMSVNTGCMKRLNEPEPQPTEDTTTYTFIHLGLVRDAGPLYGLANVRIEAHGNTLTNADTIFASTITDTNGNFRLGYSFKRLQNVLNLQFSHSNPIFNKRTYSIDYNFEKINDSTKLFYLLRKPLCVVKIENPSGKTGNYMVFSKSKAFEKVFMNLKKDTTLSFLMPEYEDIIYFDNFPQKALQSKNIRGGTNGDSVLVSFIIP